MKKALIVLIAVMALVSFGGCTKVEPGYAGIKVNNYGNQKGVSDFPVVTGRVWYNPFTTDIYKYPTFKQQAMWTDDPHEGPEYDQSITFNSIEGTPVKMNIAVSYNLDHDKVPALYVEFKKDAEHITEVFMRNEIRDELSMQASSMPIQAIYGAGKAKLFDDVTTALRDRLGPRGINIDNISPIGRPVLDPRVEASINAVIEAQQKAKEAENKVAQSRAEADQKIETARGDSESMKTRAEGQAVAKLMVAEAEAKANKLLSASLSEPLIRYENVKKWNGTLPTYMVGNGQSPSLLLSQSE